MHYDIRGTMTLIKTAYTTSASVYIYCTVLDVWVHEDGCLCDILSGRLRIQENKLCCGWRRGRFSAFTGGM
jgi:hypothetical protein